MVRALFWHAPDDAVTYGLDDQFMLGERLLAAPVVTPGQRERTVYLPAGRWLDYNDKRTVYSGQATITAKAALGDIPVFVREGAIVPRGDIVKVNNNWDKDWKPRLRLEFFPVEKQDSEFLYYTGSAEQKITARWTKDGLTIQFGDLASAGAVEVYCGKVAGVMRNGQTLRAGKEYQYNAAAKKLIIGFDGATNITLRAASSLFAPS